jgi:hypothetical protein
MPTRIVFTDGASVTVGEDMEKVRNMLEDGQRGSRMFAGFVDNDAGGAVPGNGSEGEAPTAPVITRYVAGQRVAYLENA